MKSAANQPELPKGIDPRATLNVSIQQIGGFYTVDELHIYWKKICECADESFTNSGLGV